MSLKFRRIAFLFLASFAFGSPATADILFIDFNNSTQEVEAARKAAVARGEKLILIPEVSQETKDKLYIWSKKAEALGIASDKAGCFAQRACPDKMSAECKSIDAERTKAFNEKAKYSSAHFTTDQFREAFKKAAAGSSNITSLVISGHDGGGSFGGDLGHLMFDQLEEMMKDPEIKKIADSVRSLHLWGCYGGKATLINENWRKVFPKTDLIVGFWGIAPANLFPASYEYLEDVLKKEQSLIKAQDEARLGGLVSNLTHFNLTETMVCSGDRYVATNRGVTTLSKMKLESQKCAEAIPEKLLKSYECYSNGEAECSPLPGPQVKSPLQDLLTAVRRNPGCFTNEFFLQDHPNIPAPESVLRLINHETVMGNFSRIHAKDFEILNKNLAFVGLPDKFQFKPSSKSTRKELWDWYRETREALSSIADSKSDKAMEASQAANGLENLSRLFAMPKKGIPDEWLTPNATKPSKEATMYPVSNEVKEAVKNVTCK